jgi:hypothetical protein
MIPMKRLMSLALVFLSACSLISQTPSPDTPVNNLTPVPPSDAPYEPQPGDAALTRGRAFVEATDILVLESFPLQFQLSLSGSLPTPCHELRIVVEEPDAQNNIEVDVYSVVDPNAICIQVLQPFEASVNLGSFPSGHYTVVINGEVAGEFDA